MNKKAKRHDVALAGVGGQGIITVSAVLTRLGIEHYEYVSEFPQYTASMRGGLCYSTVILSDEPIRSPILSRLSCAVAFETGAYGAYEGQVKDGGTLIVNSSQVKRLREKSADYRLVQAPALELAKDLGSPQSANFVLLGVYLSLTDALPREAVEAAVGNLSSSSGDGKKGEANLAALRKGYEVGGSV